VTYEYILINEEIKAVIKKHEEKSKLVLEEKLKTRERELNKKRDEKLRREKDREKQIEIKLLKEKSKITDSINKIKLKTNCHYLTNEIDEFDHIKVIRTNDYWVSNFLRVGFYKKGGSKYVFFNLDEGIGCASPYDNNRSFVKVKLENNNVVAFYPYWDIDCDSFKLKDNLTNSEITRLKKSPIKSMRLNGAKFYTDIQDIEYKRFFIDKLKCPKLIRTKLLLFKVLDIVRFFLQKR
jgi:hypothetical protein